MGARGGRAGFGIPDYEPTWISGGATIALLHGERLRALTGRILDHVWLAWDLDEDVWFADAPILLQIGDTLLSVDHQKFDELCLTWNVLDPTRSIEWTGNSLTWRSEPRPELRRLCGQKMRRVDLLKWRGERADMANGMVAIGFTLDSAQLAIFNALDENGLAYGRPDPNYHVISLKRHQSRS